MSSSPPPSLPRFTPWGTAVAALLILIALPSVAQATTYQIHAQSAAWATQYLRSDTSLQAPRVVSQSLQISAYDLRDNQRGDVNARLRFSYQTDLGLQTRLRQEPLFDARWNDLNLDLAYLEWRPIDGLSLTAGRQWISDPLGLSDIDGLTLRWHPSTEASSTERRLSPEASVSIGRDVHRGLTAFDPGAWDIQGLPPNDSTADVNPWHMVGAASLGLRYGPRHRVIVAGRQYHRPTGADDQHITTRRLGATATASPTSSMTVTSTASYHSTPATLDRARLDATYRLNGASLSAGLDHRRPIFESTSIFNLFGAQPHRSAYASYQRPIQRWSTAIELRTWTRLYQSEDASFFSTGDDHALGTALAMNHRLYAGFPFQLYWQLSAQTLTEQRGGDQYLAQGRLRTPSPIDDLYFQARLLGLWAEPGAHRLDRARALSTSVGADYALGDVGDLSLNIETRRATTTPTNTAAFLVFEMEAWR